MSQLGPWSNGELLMTMGEDARVGECSVLEPLDDHEFTFHMH